MKLIARIEPQCCPSVLEAPLKRDAAETLAGALRVLADPARLQLVSLLGAQPSGEACVCDLMVPLGLSQPTVSHHMKVLRDAGLVEREQRGKWAFYRLRHDALRLLSRSLAEPAFA
ncbi:MAG: metalloregulator ArsR/SmtB family transcription factor [Actinobacteria bacterium]|nr:metalloregulator ArsR/SmtB family transcription factor [Actinomycetota bacterium]